MKSKAMWIAAAVAAAGLAGAAQAQPGSIRGDWLVQAKNGHVRIAPCASDAAKLCGTLVHMTQPNDANGQPKRDANNANAALRSRPILGIPLITGFSPNGANKWSGGRIYNPEDGKTYNSKLELTPAGALKVSGCVSVICKTQIWTRVR
jgi:uncharacterized protein (DUF2147 family)